MSLTKINEDQTRNIPIKVFELPLGNISTPSTALKQNT